MQGSTRKPLEENPSTRGQFPPTDTSLSTFCEKRKKDKKAKKETNSNTDTMPKDPNMYKVPLPLMRGSPSYNWGREAYMYGDERQAFRVR